MSWYGDAWDWTKETAGDAYDGLTGEGGLLGDAKGTQARLDQGAKASDFANYGENAAQRGGMIARQEQDNMRKYATGEESLSKLMLKQGLASNVAGQQAMAASARPGSGAMAARGAMMNAGRAASGLAGQQATAGFQERQAAQNSLNQMIMQQRQQDMGAATQSRQNAISAYNPQGPSGQDKQAGLVKGLAQWAGLG